LIGNILTTLRRYQTIFELVGLGLRYREAGGSSVAIEGFH
jgi:hypothetical protein